MIETTTLFPLYVAEDLGALKKFYVSVFGLKAVFFDADFYLHLLNPETGSQLGFMLPDHSSQPEFLHPAASTNGVVITFEVADANVALQQANALDLELLMNLNQEPWGQRHFIFRDPAGFMVDIVEHIDPE